MSVLKRNGREERKVYYDNGVLQIQEFYRDGVREGERKVWSFIEQRILS